MTSSAEPDVTSYKATRKWRICWTPSHRLRRHHRSDSTPLQGRTECPFRGRVVSERSVPSRPSERQRHPGKAADMARLTPACGTSLRSTHDHDNEVTQVRFARSVCDVGA